MNSVMTTNLARGALGLVIFSVVLAVALLPGEQAWVQEAKTDRYYQPVGARTTATLPRVILRTIREDRAGNVWFATFGGPIRYDGKEFRNFGEEVGFPTTRVFSLLEEWSGAFWFGSITGGVSRWDGKTYQKFTAKDGLGNDDILCIFQDKNENVWFATGNGVSRYDGKSFTNFTTKDGLVQDEVQTITQDAAGRMWFGTKGGVSSYDGKSFSNLADQGPRRHQTERRASRGLPVGVPCWTAALPRPDGRRRACVPARPRQRRVA